MMDTEKIVEIVAQYSKHGWKLRRVLCTPELFKRLLQLEMIFEGIAPQESIVNALWFSRDAKNGGETWELRSLGETPLALLEVFDESDSEEIREPVRDEMQERLTTLVSRKSVSSD